MQPDQAFAYFASCFAYVYLLYRYRALYELDALYYAKVNTFELQVKGRECTPDPPRSHVHYNLDLPICRLPV